MLPHPKFTNGGVNRGPGPGVGGILVRTGGVLIGYHRGVSMYASRCFWISVFFGVYMGVFWRLWLLVQTSVAKTARFLGAK